MNNEVYLSWDHWERMQAYLFVERKLSDKKHNIQNTRSRFKKLYNYFYDKPFNRENFNLLIMEMKQKNYSASYMNNLLKLCKHIDRYLKLGELSDYSYFYEADSVVEVLTPGEIQRLAEVFIDYSRNGYEMNLRYKALIYFLGLTGCRVGEMTSLKWDDVKRNPLSVIFRDTKNGEHRVVPIPEILLNLMEAQPRISELVFASTKNKHTWGGELDDTSINSDLKIRAKASGIKKRVYCHIFRHSYITEMLNSGVPVQSVAKLVGHKDLNTTLLYTHLQLEQLRVASMFHPLLREALTFEMVSNQVKDYIGKVVNKDKLYLRVEETNNELVIRIKDLL